MTALSTGYLVAWWAFAPGPATGAVAQRADPVDPTGDTSDVSDGRALTLSATGPQVRWWHELPPGERPHVVLPAGWELAPPGARPAPATAQPALRLVSTSRPMRRARVRTRSS